jgi:hypothetical protein
MIPFSPPRIDQKVIDEVSAALQSGWITTGPRTKLFEKRITEYCGCQTTVAVSSWTMGMQVFLHWWGIGPGDEVILPAYTYCASANVIIHSGATPVMVDIDPADFNISLEAIEKAIADAPEWAPAAIASAGPTDAALAEAKAADGSTVEIDSLSSLLLNRNYENMEKLTGGYWEYPNAGERLHLEASDQPGPNLEPFADWLQAASGYSLGLGRSRALGHAATAYTAFRGEELMSWATFAYEQSRAERRLLQFAVAKAIGWAIRRGEVPAAPARDWLRWWQWQWPTMPEVDQLKSANALRIQQKTGCLDFAGLIGPHWRQYLTNFGEQLQVARDANLPVSMLETVAGAMATQPQDEPDNTGDDAQ